MSLAAVSGARGAACVLAFTTVACRAPVISDRLQGRWVGVRAEGVGADASPAADAFATGTELEFRRNEIFITASRTAQAGRYAVVKEDASAVTITTDHDGPSHPQTFLFAGDDTIRWKLAEGRAIVFTRD